jgi:Tol biopolymer transport system component
MTAIPAGVLLAIALAWIAPRAAEAQYFGQNKVQYRQYDWRSITSDHFEVYFYGGLDSLGMRVLDLAEKTHQLLSKRLGHTLGHRVPIVLYGSHNDFSQTNVTPELIDAGTGGFTEALRNRVVLPFAGSYEDLRHVVVHELVHAITFDLLYGGSAASLIAHQSFFSLPLWFAEGTAEYYSLGMESNAEMVLRDGTIEGYLPPLKYGGGYLIYKQGQSAVAYLVDRFGEERLRDLLQRVRSMRSFDRAFQRTMGMSPDKFDEQWRTWLRKEYWPTVAHKEDPEQFAKRLTDHRRDESNLNTSPAVSPQGDRIAYFSDRRQYTDVYLMSAYDGKVLRRLVRGERNVQFEGIPSFRSSIAWSPDGQRLALTAKSAGRDVLYIVAADDGRVLHRFDFGCEALAYPAWSPVADSLVVVGQLAGRSDLWLLDVKSGAKRRLTDDTWDEVEPTWTPDGAGITFASDRLASVVLRPERRPDGFGRYGIFTLDLKRGETTKLIDTFGDDRCPAWAPGGTELAFICDRNGTPNVYLYDQRDSSFTQLTDITGGVSSLSWSRQNDRLVFSAFNRGGFDVFSVREPLSVDGVLNRLRRQSPAAVMDAATASRAPGDTLPALPHRAALAVAWPDSMSMAKDTVRAGPDEPGPRASLVAPDSLRAGLPRAPEPPAWSGGEIREFPPRADSLTAIVPTIPLVERGGPFALPDSVLGQAQTPYRVRLSPDYAGAGFYAASGYGFGGSSQFVLSDFLGNHNVYIATDVFSNSLEDLNALVVYNYLPRRWDLGAGLFHFKNYFSSNITTLGEQLGTLRNFSERNYGMLLSASYPFDRFRRAEFNFTQMFLERIFYDQDEFGDFVRTGSEFRSVTSPSVSLIGDNSLFGYYGPVNGQRYNLTYSPAFAWFPNGLAYQTVTYDARRYWDLTRGYTFAGRLLTGVSGGGGAQTFRVGGFSTLRGYPDFDLHGSRVAIVNAEFRFPFIQQLGLVGPVPLGVFNLRGALFADAGLVWNAGDKLRMYRVVDGTRRLDDPKLGFGVGVRSALYFLIVKLDTAWKTDLHTVSAPRWHFSIGPEF